MLPDLPPAEPREFSDDESGAVTVDWIVLTAMIVMLGIGAAFYVTSSVPKLADTVSSSVETMTVTPQ